MPEQTFSLGLDRGIAILSCFSPDTPALGITELSELLGTQRSTTHRYVRTLVALGHLRQDQSKKYRLAFGVTRLGIHTMNAIGLEPHARPLLDELCRNSGLTVSLAVLNGPAMQYVTRVCRARGGQPRTVTLTAGADHPAHDSALGKLLLAYLPARTRRETIGAIALEKTGPKTITGKRRLAQALRDIHKRGIAISEQERTPTRIEVAAPVRDLSGEVRAAIALETKTTAIDTTTFANELGPHLIVTGDRISARLGYRRGHNHTRRLEPGDRLFSDGSQD
jgi:IclR family pca regulon transcriptional regulator